MKYRKTYWDSEDFSAPYQMGMQKHRSYILDRFALLNIHSLLDVGCGTGPIFDLIINKEDGRWDNITDYKGTDYSWQMIETCKKLFPEAADKFEVQDARFMKEPSNSWECVLLMHCLDHLDDYKAAIEEAVRVSSKYICIVLWRPVKEDGENSLNNHNRMGKKDDEPEWEDTHLQDYTRESLVSEFKKYNLEVVDYNDGEAVNDGKFNTVWVLKKHD